MNKIHYGTIKFYNTGRNYGFIIERRTGKEYFVCMNSLIDHVKAGSEVMFKLTDCEKGKMAIEVALINKQTLNIDYNGNDNRTE
jgi:cold shock CspA family protein